MTSSPGNSKSETLFVTADIPYSKAVAAMIASGVLVL